MIPLQVLLVALLGWLEREQPDVIAFLREEKLALKAQLTGRRLQLNERALDREVQLHFIVARGDSRHPSINASGGCHTLSS